jgi:hypothetical protein
MLLEELSSIAIHLHADSKHQTSPLLFKKNLSNHYTYRKKANCCLANSIPRETILFNGSDTHINSPDILYNE